MATVKTTAKHPKKFLQFTKIIVYSFKIFGLAPFSVEAKNLFANVGKPVCIWAVSFSKIGLAYNLLMAILIPILYALLLPKYASTDYEQKSTLTLNSDIAWSIVAFSTVWVIIVSWSFKQSTAVTIMNRLIDADFRLSLKKGPNIRGRLWLLVVLAAINVFLCIALNVTYRDPELAYFAITIPPSILISCFVTEYFLVVGLLETEFYRVNNMLLSCKEFHYPSSAISSLRCESEISDLSNHSQLVALRSLRSIHTMLYEISNDVANFFSFPILLCICHCFVTLVYCVYWTIIPLLGSNRVFLLAHTCKVFHFTLVILYPVTLLVHKVTRTSDEAKQTGLKVHKLMVTTAIPEIKAELEEFSLRILHEELNFTACGFFRLDFTLLQSMLATLVTYLVILIQYTG